MLRGLFVCFSLVTVTQLQSFQRAANSLEDHWISQDRAAFPVTPVTVFRNCVCSLQESPSSKSSKPPWECPGHLSRLCNCSPVFLSPADGLVSSLLGQWKGSVGIFTWKKGQERTTFSLWQPPGTLVLTVFLALRCSSFWRWGIGKGGRVWIHLDFSLSSAAKYAESHYQKRKTCLPPLRLEQWYDFRGKGTVMMHHNPAGIKVSHAAAQPEKILRLLKSFQQAEPKAIF